LKKALLIGNGVTAQLIYSYKDKHMIELFKRENDIKKYKGAVLWHAMN